MMNKIINKFLIFSILFLGIINQLTAQTGIGTTVPHPSTVLEINSSEQMGGVLLPRVNLLNNTDQTTVPNPIAGLMVFNTQNSGTGTNRIEANNFYIWDGTRWDKVVSIIDLKNLLLPQVFFVQETSSQTISGSQLSSLNNNGEVIVTFNNTNVVVNNGNHISLLNNEFHINTTGEYEISSYINYNCRIENPNSNLTNAIFRIQKSSNNGTTWETIAQSTAVYGEGTGGFSRTLINPPTVIQLSENDIMRCVVTKTIGADHGSSGTNPQVSVPGGLGFSKVMKIFKLGN